eukprot:scaffold1890_cov380-Prasinococcus_capsulatus_cf.AAC.6
MTARRVVRPTQTTTTEGTPCSAELGVNFFEEYIAPCTDESSGDARAHETPAQHSHCVHFARLQALACIKRTCTRSVLSFGQALFHPKLVQQHGSFAAARCQKSPEAYHVSDAIYIASVALREEKVHERF